MIFSLSARIGATWSMIILDFNDFYFTFCSFAAGCTCRLSSMYDPQSVWKPRRGLSVTCPNQPSVNEVGMTVASNSSHLIILPLRKVNTVILKTYTLGLTTDHGLFFRQGTRFLLLSLNNFFQRHWNPKKVVNNIFMCHFWFVPIESTSTVFTQTHISKYSSMSKISLGSSREFLTKNSFWGYFRYRWSSDSDDPLNLLLT